MKITLTCIFPSEQSANVAANKVKESGYDIDKVSVFKSNSTTRRGDINASNGFFENTYLPLTQSGPGQVYPEEGGIYPPGQLASVAAALGIEQGINPFKKELPHEISTALPHGGAFMQCVVSSHQANEITNLLIANSGENIKTYS